MNKNALVTILSDIKSRWFQIRFCDMMSFVQLNCHYNLFWRFQFTICISYGNDMAPIRRQFLSLNEWWLRSLTTTYDVTTPHRRYPRHHHCHIIIIRFYLSHNLGSSHKIISYFSIFHMYYDVTCIGDKMLAILSINQLIHWGRVTHICVGKLNIIGSDNGLSPRRHQDIIWTNSMILLIRPLGTNFSEILYRNQTFSFKKMHLKILSAKCIAWHSI